MLPDKWKIFFELSPHAIFIVNSQGNYTDVNEAAVKLTGFSRDELLSMNILGLLPENERPSEYKLFKELKEKGTLSVEIRLSRKTKTPINIELNCITVDAETYIGYAVDITDKIALEFTSHNLIDDYEALFYNIDQGVIVREAKTGKIISSNPAAEKILGLSTEQIYGLEPKDESWKSFREDGSSYPGEEYPSMITLQTGQPINDIVMGIDSPKFEETKWILINTLPRFRKNETTPFQVFATLIDITERKKLELKKDEVIDDFETLYENIPQGVIIHDYKTEKVVSANNAAANVLGLTKNQIMGLVPFDEDWYFINENGTKLSLEDYPSKIALRSKQAVKDIIVGIHSPKFENIRWVLVSASPRFSKKDHTPMQVFVTFTDITTLREMETKLHHSEMRWQYAIDSAGDGLWDWDIKTGKVFYSSGWKRMIGYEDHEIGDGFSECIDRIHPEDMESTMTALNDYFDGKVDSYECKHRILCKDGSYKWILDRGRIIEYDHEGNKVRMIGTQRDISKEIDFEQELINTKNSNEAILEAVPDLLFEIGSDGFIHSFHANKNDDLFIKPELFINQRLNEILPENAKHIINIAIEEAKEKGHHSGGVYSLDFDNEKRWFEISIAKKKTNEDRFIVIARNITDRINNIQEIQNLVDQLMKTQDELKNSMAEKDKFFSIIAHDLRSPFSGFLGLTKILIDDLDTLTLYEISDYLQSLKSSAESLHKLLENLLEWSKFERGIIEYKPLDINLADLFNTSIDYLESRISSKDLKLTNNLKQDCIYKGDKYMLESAFRNILSNAIKFSNKGGEIIIGLDMIDNNMEITIQDFGIGMPSILINKLFSMNEKINRIGTEGETSSGLGLLISNEFVKKHKGKIVVESEEDKGSLFKIVLPI